LIILVTGSSGFIGSKLVCSLRFNGHVVDGVDIKEGLDCRLSSSFKRVPDIIFHLASYNNAVESMTNVEKYVENIEMTQAVIKFASRLSSKPKIIFTSSCAIYGQPLSNPVKETDVPMPMNVYGFTKLASEALLRRYGNYVILRLGNVCGEGSGIFLEQLRRMKEVSLYTYDGDKTLGRDYVHVNDVIHVLLESMKLENETVNVGTGKAICYFDLISEMPTKIKATFTPCPPFIPYTISLANDKLKRLFNFNPEGLVIA
jgi:UDP-glucose 4-epimerase